MSSSPPKPTSSQLPPSAAQEPETTGEQSEVGRTDPPEPLLRLELRNLRHASTRTFLENVDAATDVANLVETVLKLLYYPSHRHHGSSATATSTTSQARPRPYEPHIPGTRSVTLIPRDMDGVAYTTGLELDDDHKEIHLSLSYISHVSRSSKGDKVAVRKELLGVICHELVHCFQWNGQGRAPGGLIEGVADWVRLRGDFVPPHWKREAGEDVKWDAGYQTTGYFLDWIENAYGEGSVRRINEALREHEYKEHSFWKHLFGKHVSELWTAYAKEVEKQHGSGANA